MTVEIQLVTILLIIVAKRRHTYEFMVNLSYGYCGKIKPIASLSLDSNLTGTNATSIKWQVVETRHVLSVKSKK